MKLIIDIPTEFECDYVGDKFKDFFSRVLCDIGKGVLCGNYEKETAEMFLKAFDESVQADDIQKMCGELEEMYSKPCMDEVKVIRRKTIDAAIEESAKAICVGCGYLDGYKCNYKGANCGVSQPMLESVVKALKEMKKGV